MRRILTMFLFYYLITINLFSNVNEVVVYKDRSLITRVEERESENGVHEIVFKSIPLSTLKESLRAKGEVSKGGGLKILDIKIVKNYEKKVSREEWEKLEIEIEEYKEKIIVLKGTLSRIQDQKKLLNIFNKQIKETSDDDLDKGKFSIKQWEEAYNFYRMQTQKLDEEKFITNKEIKILNKKIKILEDKYSKYKNTGSFYTNDAVVTYQLKNPGQIKIYLSYIVPGTYWYPVYDCRLDLESKDLVIEYYAKVFQNTGEDWNNADLILSTARPDLSGVIPNIYPWQLDFYTYTNDGRDRAKDKKGYSYSKTEEMSDELLADYDKELEIEESYQAKIDSKGVAVNYAILQKTTIPSGNEETRVTISTGIKLDPELSWAIVPRLNSSAFLKGKIKNDSDFTFLPGSLSLYVNDSFIGKSSIGLINPGQEFDLSLGRDPRIAAELKLDDVEKVKKVGKMYEKRKYLITISNNSNEDIKINIKDIIPNSLQPKKIIVKIIAVDPEPKEIENDSICNWELEIKKNDKIEITEEWSVEYPLNTQITGL